MFRMLAFLAGVATLCFFSTLFLMAQAYYWLALLLALLLIRICHHFALYRFFNIPTDFKLPLNLIFDISILFLLGMLYAQWQAANQLTTRLPSYLNGSDVVVTGTIISIVERRPSQSYGKQDFYQRFLFEVNDIAGQQWLRNSIHFEILYPSRDITVNVKENDQSCVLLVKTARDHHGLILFTGDISRRVEQHLVQTYQTPLSSQRLTADLLIVPHHGSASSSSHALLSATQPKVGLISAGHGNRYGHPNKHVVERYLSRDIELYRSSQLGAIQLVFRNGQWQGPYCDKYKARHFWQDFNNEDRCIGWLPRPV